MNGNFSLSRDGSSRAAALTAYSAAALLAASLFGFLTAGFAVSIFGDRLSMARPDFYSGCQVFPEYVSRALSICRSTVLQIIVFWLSGYVHFETPLLLCLYTVRGLAFGTALRLVLSLHAHPVFYIYLIAYALVSLILLKMIYHSRTEKGIRALSDTLTCAMIAGGFSCAALIIASIF